MNPAKVVKQAIVSSAQRLQLNVQRRKVGWSKQPWQEEGWRYFDEVGEIKQAARYTANAIARLRLYVAERDADGEWQESDTEEALQALRDLEGPLGGHAGMLRSIAYNMFVPGEVYLIGLPPKEGVKRDPVPGQKPDPVAASDVVEWIVRSTDDVKIDNKKVTVTDSAGEERKLDSSDVVIVRIWDPHPRRSTEADSSIRGVLSSCEQVLRSERHIRGVSVSRSANAGVWFLPDTVSVAAPDPTVAQAAQANQIEDPFMATLAASMMAAINDEGSAAAVVPILARVPAAVLEHIRDPIRFSQETDAEIAKQEQALTRIAQGIDLPVEVLTGKGDTNHWTSRDISEDEFKMYFAPRADVIVNGLTTGYLRPRLEASGMSAEEAKSFAVLYDHKPLTVRPNASADADIGLEKAVISESKWREVKGFTDDDAPTPEERLQRLGMMKGAPDPDLLRVLLAMIWPQLANLAPPIGPAPIEVPPADQEPPSNGGNPGPPEEPVTGAAKLRSLGKDLLALDVSARDRLTAHVEAALERALDRAGARAISLTRNGEKAGLARTVKMSHAPATLGLAADASLLDGGFPGLEETYFKLVRGTRKSALRTARIQETDLRHERSETAFAEGWNLLERSLRDLAFARLANPDFSGLDDLDGEGELPDSTIPAGLVRSVLAAAGGALLAGGRPQGDITLLTDDAPAGGIALGVDVMTDLKEDTGASIKAWQWVYGLAPRSRVFEPHLKLDGLVFESWTDDRLANNERWPPVAFYLPGDHFGCICDAVPVFEES